MILEKVRESGLLSRIFSKIIAGGRAGGEAIRGLGGQRTSLTFIMSETKQRVQPQPRRSLMDSIKAVANPVTVKGAVALLAGATVMILPGVSITLIGSALGATLILLGVYDIGYAFARRGKTHSESRLVTFFRGLAGILVGLFVLLAEQDAMTILIAIFGVYLLIRGVISLVAGLFGRERERRGVRLTIGFGATAAGVLAIVVPASLVDGLIATVAVGSIIGGGILLAYGLRIGIGAQSDLDITQASIFEILWDWVRTADVGYERRESLADTLYFDEPNRAAKLVAWWVMLLLSVAIATFAVLQDSTAVVIGAMLVAPLMTPILGLAGAIVNGWQRRAAQSSALVALGVVAAIVLSSLIARWVPELVSFEANSQITSRVNPTFVDMLIALAAGAAGAFATVNVRVASSIAGVAIAVALVPPLSVVGVALESGRLEDASGAFLLFLTNFVSIVLAAVGVFVLSGFAEAGRLKRERQKLLSTLAPFVALALVILVPLVFTANGILATATAQNAAQSTVDEWVGDRTRLHVEQVSVDGRQVNVSLTGSEAIPDPRQLQSDLSEAIGVPVSLTIELIPAAAVEIAEDGTLLRQESSAILESG